MQLFYSLLIPQSQNQRTGYLNVYEYVSTDMFEVKVGDVLSISWRTNAGWPHRNRFSLVYYNGTSSEIPMVFIVMGVCGSEINLLTLDSLYCEEVTELMGTTKSTKQLQVQMEEC